MKFLLGGVAVALTALALVAFPYALPNEAWHPAMTSVFVLAYVAMIFGALRGALAFGRGDKLRTAWLWITASGIIGCVTTTIYGPPIRSLPDLFSSTTSGLAIAIVVDLLLNATAIAGVILFARAWNETGLVPPWQKPATLVAFAIGLVIAGPSLGHDLVAALGGSRPAIGAVISGVSDIISMTLVGPLFASAVWMRGGALVGPYIYLTAYAVAWLMYDAGSRIVLGGHAHDVYDAFFAASGNLFAGLAGLSHYWVIRHRPSASGASSNKA